MKIDKDALIKHRFWIMVGLSVPLSLVALMLLATTVSGSIEKARKDLMDMFTRVTGSKDVKTPQDIAIKKAEADTLVGEETKAWAAAFKQQEHLQGWPRRMEATYHFADGLFVNAIKVVKLPAEKTEWPADKAGELHHGVLKEADNEKIKILDREGKLLTFFVTPKLLTTGPVVEDGTANGNIYYKDLPEHKEKLAAVTYQKALYFNDRLTFNELLEYKKTYHSQIPPILSIVDPLHIEKEDGKSVVAGVVQLRSSSGWMCNPADYKGEAEIPEEKKAELLPPEGSRFLRFLYRNWDTKNDFSDEAWIAQEDLWIQAEIYRLIRAANDSIALFKEVGRNKNEVLYQNPYLDILVRLKDAKTLEVKLANRLNQRQKIDGLKLRIQFVKGPKAEPEIVTINQDPLEPKGTAGKDVTKDIPISLRPGIRRDGIYGVAQVLTWETAAVKRIDQISIGSMDGEDGISLSQRTIGLGVRPLIKVDTPEAPKQDGAGAPGPGGRLPGGPVGADVGGAPKGFAGGFPGAAANANTLPHGFAPDRYQEVTPQFRRLPVAVVLIVDQNHVDRVQNTFNNSKLRFLTTQVLVNHYPQSLRPQVPSEKEEGGFPGFGGFGGFTQPGIGPMQPRPLGGVSGGPGGPGGFPRGPGAFPGAFPGGAGGFGGYDSQSAANDELEANMELVLYGVVTLYERYPPLPAGTAGTEQKTP